MSSQATDDRSGRTGTIALVLAAVSTLALLAAVVTAAVLALGDDDAAATDGSERPPEPSKLEGEFSGGQVVVGDRLQNARYEVQSVDVGWTVQDSGVRAGFAGGKDEDNDDWGDEEVLVSGVSYYREGLCTNEEERPESPALIGFENPEKSNDPEAVAEKIAAYWTRIVSTKDDYSSNHEHTDVETEEIELADGETGYLSKSVITIAAADRKKCSAPKIEVDVVSVDTGDYVTPIILVRDVDTEYSLSDDQVDEILGAIRKEA